MRKHLQHLLRSVRKVRSFVRHTDFHSVSVSWDLAKRQGNIALSYMVADMELDRVDDMEVDKLAYNVADMVADMMADMKLDIVADI